MQANSFQMCQGTREPSLGSLRSSELLPWLGGWKGLAPASGTSELPRQLGRSLLKNCMQIRVCRARETPVLHLRELRGNPHRQLLCGLFSFKHPTIIFISM